MAICKKKITLDSYLSTCTKLSCKWIKDFNIRPGSLKPTEEKGQNTLQLINNKKGLSEQDMHYDQ